MTLISSDTESATSPLRVRPKYISRDDQAIAHEQAWLLPLDVLVNDTLNKACGSDHSKRAYTSAIGNFLKYIEATLESRRDNATLADRAEIERWLPIVVVTTDEKDSRKQVWHFPAPCYVLYAIVNSAFLSEYQVHLSQQRGARSSADMRYNIVRTFLSVAYTTFVLTQLQADQLDLKRFKKKVKRERKIPGRRLSPEEVQKLLATVDRTTVKGTRDYLILTLMLYAALRREEVCNLLCKNIVFDMGRWWLHIEKGKGNKPRAIEIAPALQEALDQWAGRTGLPVGRRSDQPLLYAVYKNDTLRPSNVNTSTINRLVDEYGVAAGFRPAEGEPNNAQKGKKHKEGEDGEEKKQKPCLSPHDLRRTAARNAYDNGASILQVKELLGHANVETTQLYIGENLPAASRHIRY